MNQKKLVVGLSVFTKNADETRITNTFERLSMIHEADDS